MSTPANDSWRPRAGISALQARARCYQQIRQFFAQRHVLEVETPQLASAAVSDPQIESVAARLHPQTAPAPHASPTSPPSSPSPGHWLRTSPEYFHKRLLAAGSGDIYELGKVFRAGEAGRWHNPEFTMLEWYRVGWHYHQLMDEVETLVRELLGPAQTAWATQRLSYRELHRRILNIDPFTLAPADWAELARTHGYAMSHTKGSHTKGSHTEENHSQENSATGSAQAGETSRGESLAVLQDFIYGVAIRRHLPEQQLTFIYDYPLNQAALARIRHDTPPVAERFELFMGKIEIANGYQELTNAAEQVRRFTNDLTLRQTHGQTIAPLDQHLLNALHHGLPECSGVALGIDRLLAQLTGATALAEVLAFDIGNS